MSGLSFDKRNRRGKPVTVIRVEFTLDARDLTHGVLLAMEDEGMPADELSADDVIAALRAHLHDKGRESIDYDAEDSIDRDTDPDEAQARARELWPAAFAEEVSHAGGHG
jgi:hypothetical protein